MPRERIELSTFRLLCYIIWLWDWRAAYCATEAHVWHVKKIYQIGGRFNSQPVKGSRKVTFNKRNNQPNQHGEIVNIVFWILGGTLSGAVAQVVERSLSMWEVRGSIPRSSNEFLSELCPIVAAAWTKWDTPSHLRKDIFLLATHHSNSQKGPKRLVRSGIRTHAHRSGLRPERSALDLSAILTMSLRLLSHVQQKERIWQCQHRPRLVFVPL